MFNGNREPPIPPNQKREWGFQFQSLSPSRREVGERFEVTFLTLPELTQLSQSPGWCRTLIVLLCCISFVVAL